MQELSDGGGNEGAGSVAGRKRRVVRQSPEGKRDNVVHIGLVGHAFNPVPSAPTNVGNLSRPIIPSGSHNLVHRLLLARIEAHVGNVNDLAFSSASQPLLAITCGEDKMIKGHKSPVHSICMFEKNGAQFILSTDVDGKIKLWAQAKYGESYLAEWNDTKGIVECYYHGLGKKSDETVQFDTTNNQILAVGDQSVIKFWYMDNQNQATSIVADGGLLASPCIEFNKGGTLLAVRTSDNGLKILANVEGVSLPLVVMYLILCSTLKIN
nr:topless-related protein 4-like isoform X1 [Ipomoea batatas]